LTTRSMICVLLMLGFATAALAQDEFDPESVPPEYRDQLPDPMGLHLKFKPQLSSTLEAGYDDVDLSIIRWGIDLDLKKNLSDNITFETSLSIEHSRYDFDGLSGIPGLGPPGLHDAYMYSLSPGLIIKQDDKLSFVFRALLSWGTTDASDFSNSFAGGGLVGVKYRIQENQTLTFGVVALDRLDDEVRFLPLIGFDWKIDDQTWFGLQGTGFTIKHNLSREFQLIGLMSIDVRHYRIQNELGVPDGVMEDERFIIGGGIAWRPHPMLEFRLTAGIVAFSEIKIENSTGGDLFEEDGDVTGWVGLRFRGQF
jgi:hypothetical protein